MLQETPVYEQSDYNHAWHKGFIVLLTLLTSATVATTAHTKAWSLLDKKNSKTFDRVKAAARLESEDHVRSWTDPTPVTVCSRAPSWRAQMLRKPLIHPDANNRALGLKANDVTVAMWPRRVKRSLGESNRGESTWRFGCRQENTPS